MKLNKNIFILHRWLDLKGLRRIFVFFFYIPFLIFLYSAFQWTYLFFVPPPESYSAPVQQIWAAAAVQSLLLMVLLAAVIAVFKTLESVSRQTAEK